MYGRILVAVDLDEPTFRRVVGHARDLAAPDALITYLHVLEPQILQYSIDPTFTGAVNAEIEAQAVASCRRRLDELCDADDIPAGDRRVVVGHVAGCVHEQAGALSADLIVIGSHGRRGWRRLLGSTANGVLHGTPVDVQVIRIDESGVNHGQNMEEAP